MKRFSILLASAALGAALVASGPALARGGGGHMGGFGGGHFVGRSVAMGGFHRGFGFRRGFDHRFARFDRFRRFNNFNRFNRFGNQFGSFGAGGVYGDCDFWGDSNCGYSNPNYANGYGNSDFAYSYPDYGYPATGFTGYYAAAPLVTGHSEATGQPGSYCTISVKDCEGHHGACSCWVPGKRAPVAH